jgi:hypothetical protein
LDYWKTTIQYYQESTLYIFFSCAQDRERSVHWTAPLVWLPGCRPTEQEMSLSRATQGTHIATAVVSKLYATWGLLK